MMDWMDAVWVSPASRAALFTSLTLVVAVVVELFFQRGVRVWTERTVGKLDDAVGEILHRPLTLTVLVVGGWAGGHSVQPSEGWLRLIDALGTTALLLIWSLSALRLSIHVLRHLSAEADRATLIQPRTLPAFEMGVKTIVWVVALYFLFLAWDVDLTGWLASAGIAGVAVGFAAKDTLGNLIAGFAILADAPYKINDFLVLESGTRGRVAAIGLRSTRLLTRDAEEIVVPNALMAGSVIVNISGGPREQSRLRLPVSVAYGSDLDQVRAVVEGAAGTVDGVLGGQNGPNLRFVCMGNSALEFELDVWVPLPETREIVTDGVNTAVYRALVGAGISVPFPQLDVHLQPSPTGEP
jgi:MscS family membrane protein